MWRVYLACDWLFGYYVNSVGIVCFFILVGLIGFRVWLNGYLVRLGLFVCCLWDITFGFGLRFALLVPARYFLL